MMLSRVARSRYLVRGLAHRNDLSRRDRDLGAALVGHDRKRRISRAVAGRTLRPGSAAAGNGQPVDPNATIAKMTSTNLALLNGGRSRPCRVRRTTRSRSRRQPTPPYERSCNAKWRSSFVLAVRARRCCGNRASRRRMRRDCPRCGRRGPTSRGRRKTSRMRCCKAIRAGSIGSSISRSASASWE